jgi:hypothetical protein
MIDVDKVDIEILSMLYTLDKLSPLYSCRVVDVVDKFSYPISYYTIVRRFQKLMEKQYVCEGYKLRNAKTYFLNQKGYDFVKVEIFERENTEIPEKIYIENNDNNVLSENEEV